MATSHSKCIDIQKTCDDILSLYDKSVNDHVLVGVYGRLVSQSTLESTLMLKRGHLAKIVVDHAFKAEQQCPGTFEDVVLKVKKLSLSDETVGSPLKQVGSYATLDDVKRYVDDNVKELWLRKMLSVALDAAGFDGRIVIEKTLNVPSVEIVDGYTFNLKPAWKVSGWLMNPWVACIDGFIESVGEINRLLTEFVGRHEHMLLFVRGMSNDVLNTLRVNYDRGTLNVVPFIVNFDIDGINTIVDLSIVAGQDPVTEHKGELLSTLGVERFSTIDKAFVRDDLCSLFCDKTREDVKQHLKTLSARALSEQSDKSQIIQRRVRSMVPKQVVLRLPDDRKFSLRSSWIDVALRSIKASAHHGVIDGAPAIFDRVSTFYASRCFDVLRSLSPTSVG